MSNSIFEDAPAAGAAPADAKAKIEKQARQLAYDTKYQVKKSMTGATKMDPASVKRAYLERLQKSTASPAIKARAKQMLLGEDYLNVEDEVETSVAKALFKVFVEGVVEESDEEIVEETGERKYFVRVTDKKTGNTYRRWATRSKITELRANPNISSVELTQYGEEDDAEKKKGEKTAAVKSGKGLDPVGKEDSDVDNDGKHNTKSDKYLLHRREVRSNAIQKNEEYDFFGEAKKEANGGDRKKVDIMKNGEENKVEVFPEIKVQEEVSFIQEKSLSKAQQRFMGMVYATKKGKKAPSPEVAKAAKEMTKGEAKKYAKTKHKGLPEKVEESKCETSNTEDGRDNYAKENLIKNKFRAALGVKNPVVMTVSKEETSLDEAVPAALAIGAGLAAGAAGLSGMMKGKRDKVTGKTPSPTSGKPSLSDKMRDRNAQIKSLTQSYDPEGEMVDEARAVGKTRSSDSNPKGAGARVSSGRGMTLTKAAGLGKEKKIKNNPAADDRRKKKYDSQVKSDRRAAAKERASSGEDKLGRLIRSIQKDNFELTGELVDEGRGEFRSLGRRDRNDGRNRYMGSPTPEQEKEGKKREDDAAARAKAKLRRAMAREKRN